MPDVELHGPIPMIYDIEGDRVYVGQPGERHADISGKFNPGGIVEGVYDPKGNLQIRTDTDMPWTVFHLTRLWYTMHPELEIKHIYRLVGEERYRLASSNIAAKCIKLLACDPLWEPAQELLEYGTVYVAGETVRDVVQRRPMQPGDLHIAVEGVEPDTVREVVTRHCGPGALVRVAMIGFETAERHLASVDRDRVLVSLATGDLIDPYHETERMIAEAHALWEDWEHRVEPGSGSLRHDEREPHEMTKWEFERHPDTLWHATPAGEMGDGVIHFGTQKAAYEAMTANLAGGNASSLKWQPHEPLDALRAETADTWHKGPKDWHTKPTFIPVRVSPHREDDMADAHEMGYPFNGGDMGDWHGGSGDAYANHAINEGWDDTGYWYQNEAEDVGSVSGVVPDKSWLWTHEDFVKDALQRGIDLDAIDEAILDDYPHLRQRRTANILDPVRDQLSSHVFDNPSSATPDVKPEIIDFVRKTITDAMVAAGWPDPDQYLSLVLTGSLTTYQYDDTGPSDFDVSLFVDAARMPDWVRADLVKVMVGSVDGTKLPGTDIPLQAYVVPADIRREDLYKPGLRSGYDLDKREWIVPPDKSMAKEVRPSLRAYAEMVVDKMKLLLMYAPDAAREFWHQLHKSRQEAQRAGLGDFSDANVAYKAIANAGLHPAIEKLTGEHIAKVAGLGLGMRLVVAENTMQKSMRLIRDGKVTVNYHGIHPTKPGILTQGHVIGDHGDYEVEIESTDPRSSSIDMWHCGCKWSQYAWGRTRKWKRLEGRPCSHVRALYWASKSHPLEGIEELKALDPAFKPAPGQRVTPFSEDELFERNKGQIPGMDEQRADLGLDLDKLPRSFSPDDKPPIISLPDMREQIEQQMPAQPAGPPPGPIAPRPANPFTPPQRKKGPGPGQFKLFDITAPPGGQPVPPTNPTSIPGANPPGWENPGNPTQFPGTYSSVGDEYEDYWRADGRVDDFMAEQNRRYLDGGMDEDERQAWTELHRAEYNRRIHEVPEELRATDYRFKGGDRVIYRLVTHPDARAKIPDWPEVIDKPGRVIEVKHEPDGLFEGGTVYHVQFDDGHEGWVGPDNLIAERSTDMSNFEENWR